MTNKHNGGPAFPRPAGDYNGTGDNPIDRLIEQYNEAVVNHVAMEGKT